MSTHWGYRCETCGAESPEWFNDGEQVLRDFAQHWTELKPAYDFTQYGWLEMRVLGVHDDVSPLDFLNEHTGHALVLVNEYGDMRPIGTDHA